MYEAAIKSIPLTYWVTYSVRSHYLTLYLKNVGQVAHYSVNISIEKKMKRRNIGKHPKRYKIIIIDTVVLGQNE